MREDRDERYSEIQLLGHQQKIHCLNRHILACFLPQRTDGRFAIEVGDVAAHDAASCELSGFLSLRGHVLETSPFPKHVPKRTFPAICLQKIIQPADVSPCCPGEQGGQNWKPSHMEKCLFIGLHLSLLDQMLGVGFSPPQWVLCSRGGF